MIQDSLESKFASLYLPLNFLRWQYGYRPWCPHSTLQLPPIRRDLLATVHMAALNCPLVKEGLTGCGHHQSLHMQLVFLLAGGDEVLLQLLVAFLVKRNPPPSRILRCGTPHLISQLSPRRIMLTISSHGSLLSRSRPSEPLCTDRVEE